MCINWTQEQTKLRHTSFLKLTNQSPRICIHRIYKEKAINVIIRRNELVEKGILKCENAKREWIRCKLSCLVKSLRRPPQDNMERRLMSGHARPFPPLPVWQIIGTGCIAHGSWLFHRKRVKARERGGSWVSRTCLSDIERVSSGALECIARRSSLLLWAFVHRIFEIRACHSLQI